ncbi:hypothetical protein DYBT9623_04421 [Dyadobacter sp. CECT 9623]|uniref:Uncharacterized protein n=1 Tax=Dyadobacter linearis TaxID=2823330 RepID=A0ABM8UWL0_9BACT|nr:hypothetical protein [Dyadobacter sp. CECT 9623]CAG5072881.1 hypothetical protein DYBT9623_04421 [Dyadobacter sp. CECT 9623]
MKFLSAADFDDAVTVASKVRAAGSYVMPSAGSVNSAYNSGSFEAYIAPGAFTAGVRPGYGFHAASSFGLFLYAQSATELRIRSNSGLDYMLWHSGSLRSNSENDNVYAQLGHTHAIPEVTGLQAALDAKVPTSRLVSTGTGLTGGGTLAADRTISVAFGTTAGTVAQGNDIRILRGENAYNRWVSTPVNFSTVTGITSSGVSSWGNTAADRPGSYGTILTFIGASPNGEMASGLWLNQIMVTTTGDWFVRYGDGAIYQAWTAKQFSVTSINNWNTSYGWGNHAGAGYALNSSLAGYVPTTRTITINGVTHDLSSDKAWTIAGGVNGSGTTGSIAKFSASNSLASSSISEDSTYVSTSLGLKAGNNGTSKYLQTTHSGTVASISLLDFSGSSGWNISYEGSDLKMTYAGTTYTFDSAGRFTAPLQMGIDVPANANARGFVMLAGGTNRWTIGKQGLETGSDSGADFVFNRFSDAGALLGTAFSINRATGNTTFSGTVTASSSNSVNWTRAHSRWISTPVNFSDISTIINSGVDTWGNTAANRPSPYGTILTFVGNTGSGEYVPGAYVNQIMAATTGDWYVKHGGAGTIYQIWTSKQFTAADKNNWDSAYGWGNHAAAGYAASSSLSGYVPTSRTITINGTAYDLSANRSWTITGGVGGSGTIGTIPVFSASNTLANSSISEDPDYVTIKKWLNVGKNGVDKYITLLSDASTAAAYFLDPAGSSGWIYGYIGNDFRIAYGSTAYVLDQAGRFTAPLQIGIDVPANANARGFVMLAGGINRWTIGKQGLETGGNAGADFVFNRHNDAGGVLGTALGINRATGNATFSGNISASGGNSTNWNIAYSRWVSLPLNTSDIDTIVDSGVNTWNNTAANRPSSFGTTFTFVGNSSTGNYSAGTFVNQILAGTTGDWYVRYNGGTIYQVWTTKQISSNAISNWNTAYGWGDHAAAGYVTNGFLNTNYYTRAYLDSEIGLRAYNGISITGQVSLSGGGTLSSNRTITLLNDSENPGANKLYGTNGAGTKGWHNQPSPGGLSGSGTSGYLALWNGGASLTNSSIYDFGSYMTISKPVSFSQPFIVKNGTQSQRTSYSIIGVGTLWMQTDGTQGIYYSNSGGGWTYLG